MAFKFEQLSVWKISLSLCNEIHLTTRQFPKEELFGLSNQIKRAADSVNLNIAEGSIGQSNSEFKRFLNYALRSGVEVVSCLFIALSREYISLSQFNKLYDEYEQLCKMISRLKLTLDKTSVP